MTVSISAIEFYVYRAPLKSTFVWAHGKVTSVTNIVVVVYGEAAGDLAWGLGESVPRGPGLTGDIPTELSTVLVYAGDRLLGKKIPTDSASASLEWIADFMTRLKPPLPSRAPAEFKAFRGTFSGIEMALLDLAARVQGLRIVELLGVQRDEIRVSAPTIADESTRDQLAHQLRRFGNRFPINRLKGAGGDGAADLHRLTTTAEINRQLDIDKPIWIDINGNFSRPAAKQFIADVADRVRQGQLPKQIIVEQPVERFDVTGLADLQSFADDKSSAVGGDIIIMADETVWDSSDLPAFLDAGGCRALNIKIQKAGGLIEALKTARLFVGENAEHMIQFGGFPGSGDITAWAAVNLCLALPRLDFFTPTPPFGVERRFGKPQLSFLSDDSNALDTSGGPGLGVEVDREALRPMIVATHRMPDPASGGITATSD